jgi:hypothetical protein
LNNLRLRPEVLTIRNWLIPEFNRISISYQENNINIINASRDLNDLFFQIKIQIDLERSTVLLVLTCLEEINPEKYHFCIELLNYLNTGSKESNFTLNPETMNVSCASVIGFASYEADSRELTDTLEIYTSASLGYLTRIRQVLNENIGLVEAVERIIGDVFLHVEAE